MGKLDGLIVLRYFYLDATGGGDDGQAII